MPDFIHELIIMIIATLGVFAIVALRDMITIQRYHNTFQIIPSFKLFYEWGYHVALDISWLKWCVSITLYDNPFNYIEDELKEGDATIEDGLEDELQFRGTAVPTVPFQGSHRVTLTMNGTEASPIIFTPEMLREIKQREDTMWGRNNNDNPDTTTGENTNATDKITTITDETTS